MYRIFEELCELKGVTPYRVCKETGLTTATISNWKAGRYTPKQDKLQKIADYFGVTIEYLMTGKKDEVQSEVTLTPKDERDITKDLDRIMNEIIKNEDGPLYYNGEPIPENKIFLLRNAIEVALEDAKIKNKETYRPYKYKPRPSKE